MRGRVMAIDIVGMMSIKERMDMILRFDKFFELYSINKIRFDNQYIRTDRNVAFKTRKELAL